METYIVKVIDDLVAILDPEFLEDETISEVEWSKTFTGESAEIESAECYADL